MERFANLIASGIGSLIGNFITTKKVKGQSNIRFIIRYFLSVTAGTAISYYLSPLILRLEFFNDSDMRSVSFITGLLGLRFIYIILNKLDIIIDKKFKL